MTFCKFKRDGYSVISRQILIVALLQDSTTLFLFDQFRMSKKPETKSDPAQPQVPMTPTAAALEAEQAAAAASGSMSLVLPPAQVIAILLKAGISLPEQMKMTPESRELFAHGVIAYEASTMLVASNAHSMHEQAAFGNRRASVSRGAMISINEALPEGFEAHTLLKSYGAACVPGSKPYRIQHNCSICHRASTSYCASCGISVCRPSSKHERRCHAEHIHVQRLGHQAAAAAAAAAAAYDSDESDAKYAKRIRVAKEKESEVTTV